MSSVFVLGMILLYSIPAKSQDLDALLEKEAQPETTYATATFKSTRNNTECFKLLSHDFDYC